MRYLILCCFNEDRWNGIAESERAEIMRDYAAWVEGTVASGQHRATVKLQPVAAAKTIRMRSGKTVVTDGPFAETKEQLGGYHVLECESLEQALAAARQIPPLRAGGTVEVRPLDTSASVGPAR